MSKCGTCGKSLDRAILNVLCSVCGVSISTLVVVLENKIGEV